MKSAARACLLAVLAATLSCVARPTLPSIRIEKIVCYEILGERPAVVAPNAYAKTRPRQVREHVAVVHTDRPGLVGIGVGHPTRIAPAWRELIGLNPLDLFTVEDGRISGFAPGREKLAFDLRSMDLAILDLVGQMLGKPVAQLWGPPRRDSVEAYDSSLYFEDLLQGDELKDYPYAADTPEGRVARKAREIAKQGIRIFKIKVGRPGQMRGAHEGVDADVRAVKAVRAALPEARLFVDGNDGYKGRPEWVLEFARATRDCGLFAFEEMLPETPAVYRQLKAGLEVEKVTAVLADGEGLRDFDPGWSEKYLQSGLVGIAQPDLIQFGILGIRRWAAEAERHGAKLVCHNFGTKMGVYGSVHAALSVANTEFVETDDSGHPSLDPAGFTFRDGRFSLGGAPGLGVRVSGEVLRSSKVHWTIP